MSGRRHRVIFTHGGGRFGNQVLRFLHWMAWTRAEATDVEVLNLAFWPYAEKFHAWREHPGCVFPLRRTAADGLARAVAGSPRAIGTWHGRQRVQRAVQAAGRWLPGWQTIERDAAREESLRLDDPAVLAHVRQARVTTCCGWKIAHWPAVEKHAGDLRAFFQPASESTESASATIARLRRDHDLVVGVFIRQSDYRVWHDGRFYFETAQYATWMRQLLEQERGRRVAFLVASEERQDPALFAGLPCHFASGSVNAGGHWFASWVELAHCDLILTPPSTFSATAAFLGDVPLWPLVSAGQVLEQTQQIRDGLSGAAGHPEFSCAVK